MTDPIGDISQKITKTAFPSTNFRPTCTPAATLGRLLIGLGISVIISLVGWRRESLTTSGAAGAILSGTATTVKGGYGRAALLVGFFVVSSSLSKLPVWRSGDALIDRYTAKGSRRDIWQVVANGGVSTAIAGLGDGTPHRLAYIGSLAAVTGDTWATEIGSRSSTRPRHILSLRPVAPGVSGGVSLAGTIASFAGGAFIGGLATLAGQFDPAFREQRHILLLTGVIAGGAGSMFDSFLGATVQERRWCDRCELATEQTRHHCGTVTRIVGGVPRLNNDGVNFLCSLSGAAVGWWIERRA